MSTETDTARDFESVALAFVEELTRREAGALARYLDRYPHYARELSVLAFESAAGEEQGRAIAPATPPTALRERLRADAHAALLPSADNVVTSLLTRARAYAGLNPRALARKLDIGVDVLALLEERHIAPDTVAALFLARLATTLGASAEAVRSYLAGPPLTAARGVAYHAPKGHTPARQISFDEAIAQSNLTTPEQKARWLDSETSARQGRGD
jgi:hypothetical protein